MLVQNGVHIINVPGPRPRAAPRMSAQSLCIQIQQTGMETLLHYTCRDRNLLSIQSDLLGASSIGLEEYSLPDRGSAQAGQLSRMPPRYSMSMRLDW